MYCESTEAGTMLAQFFADGDEVAVLTNVCAIGKPGEDYSSLAPVKDGTAAAAPATFIASSTPETATAVQVSEVKPEPVQTVATANGELKVSPRAKAAAERLGINLATITPSGPEGRIIERDLGSANTFAKEEKAVAAPAAASTA
jgi:pyruvate dehydrogenase E2 component (dihydrolipoamide acetyltransferase)